MLRTVLVLIVLCLALPMGINAQDDCFPCHGRKGTQGYVDRASFQQSVHGSIHCNRCHIGIDGFPHGKVKKVICGICHFLGTGGAPREQARQYKLSVHGQAIAAGHSSAPACQTCHGSHYVFPPEDPRSRTSRAKIPALCSSCHANEFEAYRKSIHGRETLEKNNAGSATCFDCHLEHLIPSIGEDAWKLSLIRQCGNCHASEMNTYRKTYHGKVTRLGYANIAKCSDCHGSHNILPLSEQGSTLSPDNILSTCRACHSGATKGFTKFYAHAEEGNRRKYPVLYAVYILMTSLLIGVFTFFFIHTALWAYRSLKERSRKGGG